MLYEFILKIEQNQLDEIIEKMNAEGLYNFYYEQPIEVEKFTNGYRYKETEDVTVDFKIYFNESEMEHFPEDCYSLIRKVTGYDSDRISYSEINENDPAAGFEDIELDDEWVISYSGETAAESGRKVLRFEPQAAFGTGLHVTTQDCLRYILKQDFTGEKLLDLGAGSGILTIGALLKNADKVVAVDFEPVEREILYNAGLNSFSGEVEVQQADLIDGDFRLQGEYDWIFINIGGDEALDIISRHDLLNKSSNFLISGMVAWHTEAVVQTFKEAGFQKVQSFQSEEWVTIHFEKPL